MDKAQEQRAGAMWDIATAFAGGEPLSKRSEMLLGQKFEKQKQAPKSPSLEDVEDLAMSLPPQQRAEMLLWVRKRREYLAFCKLAGLEA